ncbi:MAG: 3-phosphoshikimate 1-carboxyvinyltransferase, partial [Cyanobacteria bacterium J06559_3]
FAKGTTVIQDAAELRVKESDRITAMASELNQMGARVTELSDGLEIAGGLSVLQGATVDSYADHRVGMSLAIAALRTQGVTTLNRAEAASISYPTFLATLEQVCRVT